MAENGGFSRGRKWQESQAEWGLVRARFFVEICEKTAKNLRENQSTDMPRKNRRVAGKK